ncbi:hypothetical protein Tco_0110414 [Tanacetum coccineum]
MKDMLKNCHGHNLTKGNIIKIFYHGLNKTTQEALNAAPGDIFFYKTPNQAYQLLEDKALLKLDWAKNQKPKPSLKKTVAFANEGSNNSDTDKIMAKMDAMTMKIDAQYKEIQSRTKCNHCGEGDFDALLDEGSKILYFIEGTPLEDKILAEFDELMAMNIEKNSESYSNKEEIPFEKITFDTNYKIKKSLDEPPTNLELKPLPDHLE